MESISLERGLKFLIVDTDGLLSDLVWRLYREGHHIKMYIKSSTEQDIVDGLAEKVENWEDYIDWADVIVFSDVGFGKKQEELREAGYLVIGGSSLEIGEIDRLVGEELLKKYNVGVIPDSEKFTDFDAAIDYIKRNPARYVIKPNGKAENDKELTYVGHFEDGRDVIYMLEKYKEKYKYKPNFQLQKFVDGIEIAVGAYFDGEDFIDGSINVNFEHKKMMPGDTYVTTGEVGTLLFFTDRNNKLFKELEKIKPALQQTGYIGVVDINFIVNETGAYPLEFTLRFGYPATSIEMENFDGDFGEFLYNLAKGRKPDWKRFANYSMGVVIFLPPFPFDSEPNFEKLTANLPIFADIDNNSSIHIGDLKYEDGVWKVAGASGYALVVCATANDIYEVIDKTYSLIKEIYIPNMGYRNDVGQRVIKALPKLKELGYI